jgi:hypothetical protein
MATGLRGTGQVWKVNPGVFPAVMPWLIVVLMAGMVHRPGAPAAVDRDFIDICPIVRIYISIADQETLFPMPIPSSPTKPAPGQTGSTRKLIADSLPTEVLHQMVADLPGPRDETGAARAARFEAQLAEVLSYKPRNVAEAMLATHCILLRLVADDARLDVLRLEGVPAKARPHQRSASQFNKLQANMQRTLADFQARPQARQTPAVFAAFGFNALPASGPAQSPDDAEEAFSAVIVPLHPAPKTLQ